jgi:signal transduction histidine kinase
MPMDEISALSRRFQEMSGAIERQLRELKSTDILRRELVANISHDLRTPLASLRGYIETLLVRGGGSADELRLHLTVALRQADQLGRLIDALFELARLESGAVEPHLEVFPIAELLQDVALRFRLAADSRGVSLRAVLDPNGVLVEADVQLMERALSNLLENALRYTSRGGQVRIEASPEPQLVRVRVTDTGEGFDPEQLPHIFDRFYTGRDRADPDRLGLGLAIVKRIIDLHAQSVAVQSQRGAGTTVEFTLRRVAQSANPLRAASA